MAALRPIFAENQFSPADEAVLMGLVVRKCHFDVTACAEARRLAQRAERSLRDLSALWARIVFAMYLRYISVTTLIEGQKL